MGMFDYVDYRGPLPKTGQPVSRLRAAMRSGLSQSKSVRLWETEQWGERAYEEGCVKITVLRDGTLLDPDGNPLDWSGEMRFYGSVTSNPGWEFIASVRNGRVTAIVSVE